MKVFMKKKCLKSKKPSFVSDQMSYQDEQNEELEVLMSIYPIPEFELVSTYPISFKLHLKPAFEPCHGMSPFA